MVGRIRRAADFERVLATPTRLRSAHFAVHHAADRPSAPAGKPAGAGNTELSTVSAPICQQPVDDQPKDCWLGMVVPKRHARRAVTRNLLKRQMRAALDRHASALPAGLWVLRLKAPFDRGRFTSPASKPLRQSARDELSQLLQRAAGHA